MEQKTYDVIIVGGGLAGISASYFLAKAGKKVAVLEAHVIGEGATSKTTAFLTHFLDTQLPDLVGIFGKEKAKLAWDSHRQAIDTVESIIRQENISCGFSRCPLYYYANTEKDFSLVEKEQRTAAELGFLMTLHKTGSLPFQQHGYAVLENQGKFFIHRYLPALAEAAKKHGADIFEHTNVASITQEGEQMRVATGSNQWLAKDVIIATYRPFGKQTKTHFKKGMYTSYVFELEIPKGYFPEAIYEDTSNPYNYFRVDPQENHDSMVVGGQDHRSDIPVPAKKNFAALEAYLATRFPDLRYKIASQWDGPILEPADGLALMGKIADHRYVATAFSGNGMTYSTIAGQLLTNLILGKPNPYAELYDPTRWLGIKSVLIKGRDYSQELLHGALKNLFT